MDKVRGAVVAVLLAVWCFPAVSAAKTAAVSESKAPASVSVVAAKPDPSPSAEAKNLEAREQQSRELQDFRGGAIAIYISSGLLLVVVIVLIVLLV